MCIPHWRGKELCSTSLEVQHLYILFDILSAWEISLFSLIHSIIYINIDPSTFILDYNSKLFYFVVQLVSALAIERSFSFLSCVLLTYYCMINTDILHCVYFLFSTWLLSGNTTFSMLILYILFSSFRIR